MTTTWPTSGDWSMPASVVSEIRDVSFGCHLERDPCIANSRTEVLRFAQDDTGGFMSQGSGVSCAAALRRFRWRALRPQEELEREVRNPRLKPRSAIHPQSAGRRGSFSLPRRFRFHIPPRTPQTRGWL